jgi:hypothetical protein
VHPVFFLQDWSHAVRWLKIAWREFKIEQEISVLLGFCGHYGKIHRLD